MDLAQLDPGPVDLKPQLLQAARDLDAPALVAEVAADLAHDGRRGVAGELAAARRVVAVDGVDQADHGDLGQVVDRLAAVAEAPGQPLGERRCCPRSPGGAGRPARARRPAAAAAAASRQCTVMSRLPGQRAQTSRVGVLVGLRAGRPRTGRGSPAARRTRAGACPGRRSAAPRARCRGRRRRAARRRARSARSATPTSMPAAPASSRRDPARSSTSSRRPSASRASSTARSRGVVARSRAPSTMTRSASPSRRTSIRMPRPSPGSCISLRACAVRVCLTSSDRRQTS